MTLPTQTRELCLQHVSIERAQDVPGRRSTICKGREMGHHCLSQELKG